MPIPSKLQPWFEARQRFRLSHAHIQMARELGLNPRKFGSLANGQQEPWKRPLSELSRIVIPSALVVLRRNTCTLWKKS